MALLELVAGPVGEQDHVAFLDLQAAAAVPSLRSWPGPTARTLPFCGLFLAESGRRMPPAVFSSASKRRITIRSPSGLMFMLLLPSMGDDAVVGKS